MQCHVDSPQRSLGYLCSSIDGFFVSNFSDKDSMRRQLQRRICGRVITTCLEHEIKSITG